jgi:hypothetical protein
VLPFEIIVLGTAVSHQSNDRALLRAWRGLVRAAAQDRWPADQLPLDSPLKITVVYFHSGSANRLDNDNLIKPIQDALIGLVYRDDNQITDSVVRRTSLDGAFYVRGMPRILAEGFAVGRDFVYLRIESAPDHRELL